jgi:hypothetical protein
MRTCVSIQKTEKYFTKKKRTKKRKVDRNSNMFQNIKHFFLLKWVTDDGSDATYMFQILVHNLRQPRYVHVR